MAFGQSQEGYFRLEVESVIRFWGPLTSILLASVTDLASAFDPTCIDGICFIDRGASGEIVLGHIRGGLAVLDYDKDGYPDLVVADVSGQPNRLFHNVADAQNPGRRTFLDVSIGSGLDDADGTSRDSFGVIAGDYDNDGWTDIFMTGLGADGTVGLLYHNDGNMRFTNVSLSSGVRAIRPMFLSASFSDLDLDGDLDLLLLGVGTGVPGRHLLRNNGDGTFSDASIALPPIVGDGFAYAHIWTDYDADGFPDVIIPYTDVPSILHNVADEKGGRRFTEVANLLGFTHLGPAPMGIAAGDYDGDGDFDFTITDAVVGTYYELRNGAFVEVYPMQTIFGWGVTWLDADNDGLLDNYQAGSHGRPNFDQLNRNLGGGTFQNVTSALNGLSLASQHTVQIDFNNDGRQDLITINPGTAGQTISVYENISTTKNCWINIRLRGDGSLVNSDAIGAIVRVTAGGFTQVRQNQSGSATSATEDPRVHFGLGANDVIDAIEVHWPFVGSISGRTVHYAGPIPAKQFLTFTFPPIDCNGNQSLDDVEIAKNRSADCNANGKLDECETLVHGDYDGDAVVTSLDFRRLPECLAGPGAQPPSPAVGCEDLCARVFDFDEDGDVDLGDFAEFQIAFGK